MNQRKISYNSVTEFKREESRENKNIDFTTDSIYNNTKHRNNGMEDHMEQIRYNKNGVICREGETGNCMYCINNGSVAVFSGYGTPNVRKLAELKEGEFFGEMELIENAPRSATVVAMEDDTCLDVITDDNFLDFFEENSVKVFMMLKQLSRRLRNTTKDYLEVCRTIYEYTEKNDALPLDPDLNARLIAIENEYLMFNMSGLRFY